MQVSRIGIGQMMFPGFNRSFGSDMTQNRNFGGSVSSGMVADASVADSFGSFSGSGMMGRRPLQLQGRPRNRALGQATKQPLSIAYDDAARMLSSAEAIIAQTPACNLPVIDRFRSYVKAGSKASNLELTAADGVQLDQFSLCATTKGAQGAVGSAPASASSDTLGLVVAGVAAAALVGFMFWHTR